MLGQRTPPAPTDRWETGLICPSAECQNLKLPVWERMIYALLSQIHVCHLPKMDKLISVTIVFGVVTWKSCSCCWPELCGMYTDNSRRKAAPVLPGFFFFNWQLQRAGFHSFSGTFATVPPTALNNSVLCGCVRWRESCARLCPLFLIERLAGRTADPLLLCYLRADKGSRC